MILQLLDLAIRDAVDGLEGHLPNPQQTEVGRVNQTVVACRTC